MQRQLITLRLFMRKTVQTSLCLGPNWGLHSIQRCDSHSNANVQGMHSNMCLNVFKLKILFKIHFKAQHNKRKEIKKYKH